MASEKKRSSRKKAGKTQKSGKSDRYGWVLTISILFHVAIVLGISFVLPSEAGNRSLSPPLKITMVPLESDLTDPETNVLAQFNSSGDDVGSLPAIIPQLSKAQIAGDAARQQEQLLLEEQAKAVFSPAVNPEPEAKPSDKASRDSLADDINIAFLNSQAQPRERFVSANTKASEIAPYLEKWRLLVERVGNLNYPDAAKVNKIEGDLVMDVSLSSDGSVQDVSILRSSGQKILDDAAERIVYIAAPYDQFSDEMKREFDTLHVIRTWRFSHNRMSDVTE